MLTVGVEADRFCFESKQSFNLENESMTDEKTDNPQTATDEAVNDEIKNQVTVSEAGPCKKKIEIEIPEQKIREYLDKKYQDLRKEAVLPGFRKGRAPLRLVEKRFGTDISNQTKLELIVEASEAAIKDNELDALGEPDIDHEKIELPESGPMTFEFEVEVRPDFDLPDLEGITIEKPPVEVSDEQVEQELLQLRNRSGVWTPKDKSPEPGDQVIADVVLVTEGLPEHDKRDNIEITVRPTGLVAGIPVEGLDELLKDTGHGDRRKTTVEVPATYYDEQYRGKKVDIEITVKDVKVLEAAEMSEEFLSRFGADDPEQLNEMLRDHLESQAERKAQSAMRDQVYAYLRDKVDLELPESVLASQSMSILQRQYSQMLMQGMSREQIDEQMDQLRLTSEQQAKDQLKMFFVMDKLADTLDVSVSQEEINSHIAYVASMRGRRPEPMREEMARDGSLSQFLIQIREQKCVEKILEKADISGDESTEPAADQDLDTGDDEPSGDAPTQDKDE